MRYQEILEACWTGYRQAGMKKKGDRQVPNCVPVQEATDIFLDNVAREIMAVLFTMGAGLSYGVYLKIRSKLDRYQGYQIVAALEDKGVAMNRETYLKVKPVLDQFRQALKDNDGAEAKALAKRIEQMIVMGKLSAPEPQAADAALAAKERELQEDLKKWFKEKWVRFGPDGKIRGDCARGSEGEGKPKCLPQAKAQALGKKGRASAAAKKRREDPNPERRGAAKNVATRVKEAVTLDRTKVPAYPQDPATIKHRADTAKAILSDPKSDADSRREAGAILATLNKIDEKQDACYSKVKSRYKVWPSAYASGALVQCRKKGAANWGNKNKKE